MTMSGTSCSTCGSSSPGLDWLKAYTVTLFIGTGVVGVVETGQWAVTTTPATSRDAPAKASQRSGFIANSP